MKIVNIILLLFLLISLSYSKPIEYPNAFLNDLKITLKFEGGYFAEEHTNFGIMQGTYDAYRNSKKLLKRDVKEITKAEIKECYYVRYYKRGNCDSLGSLLSIAHFDACVNFGITGASGFLSKIKNDSLTDKELALKYCDARIERRYDIVKRKPEKKKFLKGWLRRDNKLKKIIQNL